jgi:2',3'-cyclic-nucleotide 2'-phosphodiesterase (5'-nucleotidase family)
LEGSIFQNWHGKKECDEAGKEPVVDALAAFGIECASDAGRGSQPAEDLSTHIARTRAIQGACEFASTMAAGITGTVIFGRASAAGELFGVARTLGLVAGGGGLVKYAVKSGLEHIFLSARDRDVSKADLAWGAVDGLSGVVASKVESTFAENFLKATGRKALGQEISDSLARTGGEKVVAQTLMPKLKLNLLRGATGGAAGTFAWSVPHRLYDHWDEIEKHPLSGLDKAKSEVINDTLLGTCLGGGLSAGGTALFHSIPLARTALARLEGDAGVSRLDLLHVNDHHSELVGSRALARMVTKAEELGAKSEALGRSHQFVNAGDLESGNVSFAFSEGGWVENEAMARAGEKIRIPGNHPYDVPGGGSDIERYQNVMQRIMADHPDINLLAANLDLSAYPEYAKLVKPYTTIEIKGASGTEKVGVIGLITEEGALGKIKYRDAAETAERYIAELHSQGINKIVILSHQGLAHDISLAQRVKGITAIVGGHSHDVEPVPRWVTQGSEKSRFWQKLNPWRVRDPYAGWDVPVVQAGSNGRWLGELNLAMKESGAADRLRTTGRLHAITRAIPANREIEQFVNSHLGDLNRLRMTEYNSEAVAPYSLSNIRNNETPLGNLVSDATAWGARRALGNKSVDFVLTHSGGIRAGINPHEPITRFDLSNVFINAGNIAGETREQVVLDLTGRQLKDILEFSVHDLAPPRAARGTMLQELHRLLGEPQVTRSADKSGNFIQVSSELKYSFDLSKSPRLPGESGEGRISQVLFGRDGHYTPLADDGTYKVLTRFHEAEKWYKWGAFGQAPDFDSALSKLNRQPVELSRVDLTGAYISGKTLDPAVAGKIEGRITDLTARPVTPSVYPGLSLVSYSGVAARDRNKRSFR